MTDQVLKSADEWLATPEFAGATVLDPDGWDRKNFEESWAEKIDHDEMMKRFCISTVMIKPDSPMHPQNILADARVAGD